MKKHRNGSKEVKNIIRPEEIEEDDYKKRRTNEAMNRIEIGKAAGIFLIIVSE